jgi:hypothetical protein
MIAVFGITGRYTLLSAMPATTIGLRSGPSLCAHAAAWHLVLRSHSNSALRFCTISFATERLQLGLQQIGVNLWGGGATGVKGGLCVLVFHGTILTRS